MGIKNVQCFNKENGKWLIFKQSLSYYFQLYLIKLLKFKIVGVRHG